MASLSLPRVLHPRKTSLEIERENFEKSQTQALNKAINGQEAPVKQKHVRSAIIGTFQTQGAKVFWAIAIQLPSMDDRIVAWKLCHVVHKVLREGHPLCLVHSQRHRKDLDEIGKLWVHLKDGYGKMIRLYTTLLITKLDFHRRNPRFPGHLGVTPEELDSIGGNDINNYFQMTVEMFDYLDCILDLQAAVFGSLNMARSNSMTSAGQCRLSPLIPCIQDASKLYDYCVKMLFKLYVSLPASTLEGHRDRFLKQFKTLKQFYQNTSNLQYFKDLINIPPLPEHPPNFTLASELRQYVTHEVYVQQEPEPEHEEEPISEGSLIDTSDVIDMSDAPSQSTVSLTTAAHQELLAEKEYLQNQCDQLRYEISSLVSKNQQEIIQLRQKLSDVETNLATKESELMQERHEKGDLLIQVSANAQSQDSEMKVKDEKFNKLKDIYYKLRDEHIQKIRENDEIKKKFGTATKKLEEIDTLKSDLEKRIRELEDQQSKVDNEQKRALQEQNGELENLRRDKELFNMETEILKKSVNDVCKERDTLKLELQNLAQEKEEVKKKSEELSYKLLDLERQLDIVKNECKEDIEKIIREAVESSKEILKNAIHEVDNPALASVKCSPYYLQSLTKDCREGLQRASNLSYKNHVCVIVTSNVIAHRIATYILQGRATCNTSPDITFGERMADVCKVLGEIVVRLLNCLQEKKSAESLVVESLEKLEEIAAFTESISTSLSSQEAGKLADMLENEMTAMDKAIEEAAKLIEEMLKKSREADSGIKLEVNSKILDSCTNLMQAIRVLVQKSRILQAEIVSQGRGTASAKEFYKRNHQWTDGFISAAKAVAMAARFLLTAADETVTKNGKLEQIVVAAGEIAASTAQLVVASRVKADRKSDNLHALTQASKGVTSATGVVVATVKDCSQLIDDTEELDVSNLTLHQAKRLEMESQVRVLELEKELEQERLRLSALRRHHYQLAGENET